MLSSYRRSIRAAGETRLGVLTTVAGAGSRGMACGWSIREIARHLDRAASTVGREVTRHGGRPTYRAHKADDHAWQSALRPKKCLLALHPRLREVVTSKLILDWSPKQISGWLKTEYPV